MALWASGTSRTTRGAMPREDWNRDCAPNFKASTSTWEDATTGARPPTLHPIAIPRSRMDPRENIYPIDLLMNASPFWKHPPKNHSFFAGGIIPFTIPSRHHRIWSKNINNVRGCNVRRISDDRRHGRAIGKSSNISKHPAKPMKPWSFSPLTTGPCLKISRSEPTKVISMRAAFECHGSCAGQARSKLKNKFSPVISSDLFPTLLDVAGWELSRTDPLDGKASRAGFWKRFH